MGKIIIDGNQCYEIDEECIKKRRQKKEAGKMFQSTNVREAEKKSRKKRS